MQILKPGDARRKQLDQLQARIAELKKEIETVERAPRPDSDVRAEVRRAIADKVKQVDPVRKFAGFRSFGFEERRPALPDLDWSALIGLLGADVIESRIVSLVTESPSKPAGLPVADREPRIRALEAELRSAERSEELETLRLETEGGHCVIRRKDVDVKNLFETWSSLS